MHKPFRTTNKIFGSVKIEGKLRALRMKTNRGPPRASRDDPTWAVPPDMPGSKAWVECGEGARAAIGGPTECGKEFAGVSLQTNGVQAA